jgi:hypothetical protein
LGDPLELTDGSAGSAGSGSDSGSSWGVRKLSSDWHSMADYNTMGFYMFFIINHGDISWAWKNGINNFQYQPSELSYHLVMTNSLPWKITMLLIGKPSISMAIFHGIVK